MGDRYIIRINFNTNYVGDTRQRWVLISTCSASFDFNIIVFNSFVCSFSRLFKITSKDDTVSVTSSSSTAGFFLGGIEIQIMNRMRSSKIHVRTVRNFNCLTTNDHIWQQVSMPEWWPGKTGATMWKPIKEVPDNTEEIRIHHTSNIRQTLFNRLTNRNIIQTTENP